MADQSTPAHTNQGATKRDRSVSSDDKETTNKDDRGPGGASSDQGARPAKVARLGESDGHDGDGGVEEKRDQHEGVNVEHHGGDANDADDEGSQDPQKSQAGEPVVKPTEPSGLASQPKITLRLEYSDTTADVRVGEIRTSSVLNSRAIIAARNYLIADGGTADFVALPYYLSWARKNPAPLSSHLKRQGTTTPHWSCIASFWYFGERLGDREFKKYILVEFAKYAEECRPIATADFITRIANKIWYEEEQEIWPTTSPLIKLTTDLFLANAHPKTIMRAFRKVPGCLSKHMGSRIFDLRTVSMPSGDHLELDSYVNAV